MNPMTLLENPNRQQLEDLYTELCRVRGDDLTDRFLAVVRECAATLREPTTRLNFQAHTQVVAAAVRDAGLYPELSAVGEEWVRINQKTPVNLYEVGLVLMHGPVPFRDLVYQQIERLTALHKRLSAPAPRSLAGAVR